MTFALISSSAVMAMAVGAARAANPKLAFRFLLLTIVGGLMFLGCQAFEWSHLIGEGARLTHNPWGVPQFAASFFVITGFHGFHVLSGVTILLIVAIRAAMGKYSADQVENAGLVLALRRRRLGFCFRILLPPIGEQPWLNTTNTQ